MSQPSAADDCLWIATAGTTAYPALDRDLEAEVVVVGGGIVGLTAALLAAREGRRVVLLERDKVAMGVSPRATVKVSTGHGTLYSTIRSHFDDDRLRAYGEANLRGFRLIEELIGRHAIDCDWEPRDHFVWAEDAKQLEQVRDEVDAERIAGLASEFVDAAPELPFEVTGALRLPDQAQFHPRRYLLGLARAAEAAGVEIYERTPVSDVDGGASPVVDTPSARVRGGEVILATHFPIVNRKMLFAEMTPKREYSVAGPVDPQRAPKHMYIGAGSPTRSIRIAPSDDGPLLIVVGEGHKVGERVDTEGCYRALEAWGAEHFGVGRWTYRWSNQDNMSMDGLPFVGRLEEGVSTATGLNAWGMTMGTVAAEMLASLAGGREDPLLGAFDPARTVHAPGEFLKQNIKVAGHFVGGRLAAFRGAVEEIAPGSADVVRIDGTPVAVYRDDGGALHAVTATCTHMGCLVEWNAGDRSWDCPCHGSRFGLDGRVLNSPATEPLERIDPAD